MEVQYFKAQEQTHRFNLNQKVWISLRCANHLYIYYRFRGKHRYARGVVDRWSKPVGELKTISVSDNFAERVYGELYDDIKGENDGS